MVRSRGRCELNSVEAALSSREGLDRWVDVLGKKRKEYLALKGLAFLCSLESLTLVRRQSCVGRVGNMFGLRYVIEVWNIIYN